MNKLNDAGTDATRLVDVTLVEFENLRAAVRSKRYYLPIKRACDISLSAAMLIMLAPLMLVVAFLVMTNSPGPIVYRAQRHGQYGKPFMILKFRSMVIARPDEDQDFKLRVSSAGELPKSSADPRITPIGRWLRRWSIDELPQLVNVLIGDMSLIGPRPVLPEMLEPYPMFNRMRTIVRPGLGGLWQVRDRENATHVVYMWSHDLEYLERMSFGVDLVVLIRTAMVAFRRTGAK